jgi:hypothetical protein
MGASFKCKCPAFMTVDSQYGSVLIVTHEVVAARWALLTLFPGPGYYVQQTREQVIDLRQKLKTAERGDTQT